MAGRRPSAATLSQGGGNARSARYGGKGMDGIIGLGFDARRKLTGRRMTDIPDDRTLYVGQAMAYFAIRQFAINVSSYLSASVSQDGESGEETVVRLLEMLAETPLNLEVTDYGPGDCDMDAAQAIALDTIREFVDDLREKGL